MERKNEWDQLRAAAAVRQRLECLHRSGVQAIRRPTAFDVSTDAMATLSGSADAGTARSIEAAQSTRPSLPAESGSHTKQGEKTLPVPKEDPAEALNLLRNEVSVCMRCPELVGNRTQTVFGVGNIRPRLCFFGEAPGADEDRLGEPFVGRAGELLDKIIRACTLKREDVYILNVLKCRPPGNRNPMPDEVANCRRYFERQLEILQPEYICCLGASAAQTLLRTTQAVGRLRGTFHEYRGSKVMVTYHPAYLLRSPNQKKATWQDMKMLMADMGLKLPAS